MDTQNKSFKLRHLALLSNMNLCKPINCFYPSSNCKKLHITHEIGFINDHNIRMRYLQVCGSHQRPFMFMVSIMLDSFLNRVIKTLQNIFGINEGNDTIQVY